MAYEIGKDFWIDYIVDHQTGDTLYNIQIDEWLLKDGAMEQTWDQVLESYQRVKWREVRNIRNRLLKETDWVTLRSQETGNPVPFKWQKYRQQLRDITDQCSDVDDVVWPEMPE